MLLAQKYFCCSVRGADCNRIEFFAPELCHHGPSVPRRAALPSGQPREPRFASPACRDGDILFFPSLLFSARSRVSSFPPPPGRPRDPRFPGPACRTVYFWFALSNFLPVRSAVLECPSAHSTPKVSRST